MQNLGKETETLEFKKTTGEVKEGMVSISSILNKHKVGTLYFGVKPNGDATGQDVSESSLRDVSRAVYESIRPQIYPVITEEILDDRHVIKVEFEGSEVPYSAYGRYYLRTADEDREVSPAELKKFFVANEYKEKWEKTKSEVLKKDVDKSAVKKFCEKAIAAGRLPDGKYTAAAILDRFGLTSGDYLTNAGNVLFGKKDPVTLKAAIFATDEKLTFIDMQMFEDNIINLLDIGEQYILKNIHWAGEITDFDRNDIPEIPVAVIREALANSFAHSIYNGSTYHEICIYPSKVTIYSPGIYASSHKPEEYIKKNLQSSIRNEKIAKLLFLSKSIEQFGSGFKRINSLCKDAKIKFSYETDESGFTFIVNRKKVTAPVQTADAVAVNVTENVTLNKMEKLVYQLLSSNPQYTREELAEKTSKTVRTIQRTLNSLRDKEYISRIGSDKTGSWEILK